MRPLNVRSHNIEQGRLQAIVNSALDGLITLDNQGCIESFNPACERIFGYTATEVMGQNISILMPEIQQENIINISNREGAGHRKNGSSFPLELSISPFKLEDGQHFCGIIRDITERKTAELQHQHLMQELIQSNTELERFAYVASHDMQEPVRMVINFSRMIAADYSDKIGPEGQEYLNFITESADRIHCMIDDLLDYARMGNEERSPALTDGSLELKHALANLGKLIEETGAQITHDPLPSFQGHPVQFMRLMQNMISNAIKYQVPGNIPKIHIGVEDLESTWRISIQDNGIGIDESFINQIFEPFRRLHSWEQIKGTGIGLAVCKKIVENHGGSIGVQSTPQQGSTFFIVLPKQYINKKAA